MSITTLLMPAISAHLLSRERLLARRARAERARVRQGGRHQLHYFHQPDDPYSALTAASLQTLVARHDVELLPHVVGAPAADAAPQRDRLIAYSRKDARLLARHHGLEFEDPGVQPPPNAVEHAAALLVAAIHAGRFVEVAQQVSTCLWQDAASLGSLAFPAGALQAADPGVLRQHREAANALRQRMGHYLGATFHFGGEWYWGLDRLHHLEQRLLDLGAQRPGVEGVMFPARADQQLQPLPLPLPLSLSLSLPLPLPLPLPGSLPLPLPITGAQTIDFYFSLRSPYSAIVAQRVFELGRRAGAQVRLRYLLPMVMRGLPVPRNKRMYIAHDAAREAFARDIAFGRLNDPVGRPTERGLALIPYAEQAGKGQQYVLSFMRGVWAEGIDAGSGRGLRKIVERAGLSWEGALHALQDEAWRHSAEQNRAELFDLGLWGVPSFRVGAIAVWGQDRLWAVEDELCRLGALATACGQ